MSKIYKKENGIHIWEIPLKYKTYFKRNVITKLLFDKDNYLNGLSDYKNIINGDDYWITIEKISNKINSDIVFVLDMNIQGCETVVTVDCEKCILTIGMLNYLEYEKDMINHINELIENM